MLIIACFIFSKFLKRQGLVCYAIKGQIFKNTVSTFESDSNNALILPPFNCFFFSIEYRRQYFLLILNLMNYVS